MNTRPPKITNCPGTSALGCSSAIDVEQVSLCAKCLRATRGRTRTPAGHPLDLDPGRVRGAAVENSATPEGVV